MENTEKSTYEQAQEKYRGKLATVDKIFNLIKPGQRVFISSGTAIPAYFVDQMLKSDNLNLQDLEIIQLITLGEYLSHTEGFNQQRKYRLKTFNVGESITKVAQEGRVDFIPANLIEIPFILSTGAVEIDIAVVQTSPPDEKGFMSLGIAVDVANIAIKKASIVIAEVNPNVPVTYGETSLHIDQFDYVIESDIPLIERERKPFDETMDKIGWHISNLIEDGSTVVLHAGRIFDAIAKHLQKKKNLGIYTHVISDWVMDLIECGAVSLDRARTSGGLVTTSYCYGTKKLYDYVNRNPIFAFYPLTRLINPRLTQRASKVASIMNVKRIDVSGESVIFYSGDNLLSGYESKLNFAIAATFSRHGKAIVTLSSVDQEGNSNIVIAHKDEEASIVRSTLGATRYVVTEYGTAFLFGKSIRERVLTMIDIAHPDHRERLLQEAKDLGYIYPDQIYVSSNARNYPFELETMKTFKNDLNIKIRPIKPSDEDMMRRLFYKFSDESRYFRYFYRVSIMPHKEMQKYVNVDYENILSIVAVVEKDRTERIIAEARYAYYKLEDSYEMAFISDEEYQGRGIATFMMNYLMAIAKKRGIRELMANVLPENEKMLKVFKKSSIEAKTSVEDGVIVKRFLLQNEPEQ